MKGQAIDTINDFIYENLFEPSRHWPEEEFQRKSCERWAANEIINRIKVSNRPPIDVVYLFMLEMRKYSLLDTENKNTAHMFELAYEIADEIGSILC